MKLNRPPGKLPELTRLGGLGTRQGLSLLGICLFAAVIGGLVGGARLNTQAHHLRLAAFVVGSTPQTITFDQPQDTKVGELVTLSASATSELSVSFTSNTPAVCTVSGSAVTTMTAGMCVITASQDGDATYAAAPKVAQSFQATTGQTPQTISFALPPEVVTAGVPVGQPVALSASAASGLAVSFTSSTPAGCTVSGSTVLTVASGTCTITASQGGSSDYAAATPVTQSFQATTGQTPQTISFALPPEVVTAGVPVGQPVALSASAASGLEVSFTSDTPQVCTVSGSTVLTVGTGTCTITASQDGSSSYAPAPDVPHSFECDPGGEPQTITFDPVKDTPARTPVALHATASSKLRPVTFASDTPKVCTVTESAATGVKAGRCAITATQAGDDTWAPAQAQQIFTVTKAEQTITFDPLKDTPARTPVPLHATTDSQLPVTFASSTTDVCTVEGTTATGVKAGRCTITATAASDDTWAPAQASQTFTVTRAEQTITFDPPPDNPARTTFPLHATADPSGLPVSFSSGTQQVCTVSGTAASGFTATTVTAGTCTITATQGGDDTWAPAADVTQLFAVTKAEQKIIFTRPSDSPARTQVPLHATADPSGLPVAFTSSTTDVCTVTDQTASTLKPGICTITATQDGNDTWAAATNVQHSFRVVPAGKKSQTIAFAQPSPAAVGQSVTLSASASSGLAVSFSSSTSAVCTVSGSTVTTVAVGTCVITAAQSGNADYAPARDVTQSFQVNQAGQKPQTITFTPPTGTKVGEPVTLSASASSGLPVSFASGTPAVCTVSGSTATPVAAGTCAITASQSGNASYAPARAVTQSFQVNPPGPVHPTGHKQQIITFDPPTQAKAGDPVALSASASSGLPVAFASDTPPVCTVSGSTVITMAAGACTITASQGGSSDYAAAPIQTRSFQVDPASPNWTGPLVYVLAAAVMTAAGVAAGVRRLRLRSRPPLVHAPSVRAVPEPGPPGQVDIQNTGPAATRTVRIESDPGASVTTIEEARP
jgi:hypothetical protein